jgi:tRNA-2-methylthio-N6-dimethylallyladenosine synthase
LLARVNEIHGIERIRFMTSHPKDLSERLINAMATIPKVCNHLHLPLQSGSDTILTAMNRKYTIAFYRALAEKVRARIPDISLTTDILIGFPGETEEDFQQTLDAINTIEFNALFAFKYSPRQGTASFAMTNTVSEEEIDKRLARVLEAADRISIQKNATLLNTVQQVLIEKTEDGMCTGRTRTNTKVFFPAPAPGSLNGRFAHITISQVKINTLVGACTELCAN